MALDEEALKQFIAQLPDPDKYHEISHFYEDEAGYIAGVRDAYRVLMGEEVHTYDNILKETRKIRNHAPAWRRGTDTCAVCGIPRSEGDVPWHSTPA